MWINMPILWISGSQWIFIPLTAPALASRGALLSSEANQGTKVAWVAFRPMLTPLLALSLLRSGTDLTFVRHAETEANASGHYSAKTLNSFSQKGQAQVSELTRKLLSGAPYDAILVSPSPRAMRTILPYLKASRQTATIWPLLYECCTQKRPAGARSEPFKWDGKVAIPADCKGHFKTLAGEDHLPVATTYNQGLGQVAASLEEFRSKLAHGRVLLVGHSGHGGQFLHGLTGKWRKVENAQPMSFHLP